MKYNKKAFTMIELVFVIVVLGILSAIAIPKFAVTRTDAQITKGRADVASLRSAIISDRQSRLIKGDSSFIAPGTGAGQLDSGSASDTSGPFFGGVLTYSVTGVNSSGHWHTRSTVDTNTSTVKFKVSNTDVTFTYTKGDGIFTCTAGTGSQAQIYCGNLIN